jgi:hypothetical protein
MDSRFVIGDEDTPGIIITRKDNSEYAKARLAALANVHNPAIEDQGKYVRSPWKTVAAPTVDTNAWANATLEIVELKTLLGTDPYLSRKNIKDNIKTVSKSTTPDRDYALVAVVDGSNIIVDGHHRLLAQWLLGKDTAPVWKVEL